MAGAVGSEELKGLRKKTTLNPRASTGNIIRFIAEDHNTERAQGARRAALETGLPYEFYDRKIGFR
jgi:hypothetical protein